MRRLFLLLSTLFLMGQNVNAQGLLLQTRDNEFIAKVALVHMAGYYCPGWQARSDVETLSIILPMMAPDYTAYDRSRFINAVSLVWNGATSAATVAQPVTAPGDYCALAAGLIIQNPALASVPLRFDF